MRSFVFKILLFCLAPFFAMGVYGLINTYSSISDFEKAQGTVVANVQQLFGDGTFAYVPQIKFTTQDGLESFFYGTAGSLPPSYEIGEKIEVLYHPQNLSSARLNSFMDLWFADALFVGLSVLIATIVFFVLPKGL